MSKRLLSVAPLGNPPLHNLSKSRSCPLASPADECTVHVSRASAATNPATRERNGPDDRRHQATRRAMRQVDQQMVGDGNGEIQRKLLRDPLFRAQGTTRSAPASQGVGERVGAIDERIGVRALGPVVSRHHPPLLRRRVRPQRDRLSRNALRGVRRTVPRR